MNTAELTQREEEVMQHALGLNRGKKVYRNHFVASKGHHDWPVLKGLVARKLMHERYSDICQATVFSVTVPGFRALGVKP